MGYTLSGSTIVRGQIRGGARRLRARKPAIPALFIGAPRFEIGTSSPPDYSGGLAGDGPRWREMASLVGLRAVRAGFRPHVAGVCFRAFGPCSGHGGPRRGSNSHRGERLLMAPSAAAARAWPTRRASGPTCCEPINIRSIENVALSAFLRLPDCVKGPRWGRRGPPTHIGRGCP
jgi:hypothetical protein